MSDYIIRGIPAELVERMWTFAEPYVKRALDHAADEFQPDDIKLRCIDRDIQLWLVSHETRVIGAATTEIVLYPQKKHCRIITIAGSDFSSWVKDMDHILYTWAQSLGCDALEAHVRKGFVPKLAPIGYKHLHSVVHKKIDIIAPMKPEEIQ